MEWAIAKKLLYKGGKLFDPFSGEVLKQWPVKNETIIPNEYKVEIETLTDNPVTIFENEEGVFIKEGGKETRIEGTDKNQDKLFRLYSGRALPSVPAHW